MTINYLVDFKKANSNAKNTKLPHTIFSNKNISINTNVYSLPGTTLSVEMMIINSEHDKITNNNCELVLLSEPCDVNMDYEDLISFKKTYEDCIKISRENNVPIVHIVTNTKWFYLFENIIETNEIQLFIPQSLQEKLNLPEKNIINIKEYISMSHFINYSNDLNEKILLDLTEGHEKEYHYKLNFSRLMENVKNFSSIDIIISDESFIPDISDEKINVFTQKEYDWERLKDITYIYHHSNSPYSMEYVNNILFYSLNSKIVYTNYNYYINNLLPSVVMNLSKKTYNIEKLPEKEAFDIINENRNTVLFNNTLLNIINDITNSLLEKNYISSYNLSEELDDFTEDMYLKNEVQNNRIDVKIKTFKYDIERTLTLPIIFLGLNIVYYEQNKATYGEMNKIIKIPLYTERINMNIDDDKSLSMIIPIHNNGRYLKYKCFNSVLRLSCINQIEIIFIDDGSTDDETKRIIQDLRDDYPNIVYKRFEKGSGSASRPRNIGMTIASCKYLTFLDPDNEAIEDGYTFLLKELNADRSLDMVVANIVREDNVKRNDISYYNKVIKVRENPYIENMKKLLFDTNLSVQSIQALIVKKEIIDKNKLTMIEGAAGQDTLFFQELLLKCNKIKVIDKNVHSYYAFVEGSVTNTVSHKFFEKFYKVENDRKKFLEREGLIEFYMDIRFNSYMKNWYYTKFKEVRKIEEAKLAKETILKIFDLYEEYNKYYNDDTKEIKHSLKLC